MTPVLIVGFTTFLVVTSEMMPVGVLTPLASSLHVSVGLAGVSLTITGMIAAVVSVLAPVLAGRLDRRVVLTGFMVILSVANAISALAQDFVLLAVSRVLLGAAMGMVWGLAAGLGPRLATGRRVALATTVIFSGVSIASVLGVPLGTLVADLWGWRMAFWGLAGLGAVSAALLFVVLPPLPVLSTSGVGRVGQVFAPLRNSGVMFGILLTMLLVLGHFTGYTYIRPFLEAESGMGAMSLATVLFIYGIAGVAGNFVLGPLAGKKTRTAVVLAVGGVAAATLLLATGFGRVAVVAGAVMVLWGFCYGGLSVSTQTWTAKADPARIEASSALWAGAFNASIAGGAMLGAATVDGAGATWAMWSAAAVSALALLIAVVARPNVSRDETGSSSHDLNSVP